MHTIKRIMAACDLSEFSDQGLRYAIELAGNLEAVLIIANVINQRDLVAVGEALNQIGLVRKKPAVSMENYTDGLKQERIHRINTLLESIAHDHLKIKKIIKVGVPFQKLVRSHKRGTGGYSGHGHERPKQYSRNPVRLDSRKDVSALPRTAAEHPPKRTGLNAHFEQKEPI